jgi:hydroxyacylglutathione hydrolase
VLFYSLVSCFVVYSLQPHSFVYPFCSAHEYTLNNAKFAASVEPGNPELMARVADINAMRRRGESTVPSQLGVEKRTNPFLRCDISDEIRKNVGVVSGDSDAEAFGKVRKAKDTFRG